MTNRDKIKNGSPTVAFTLIWILLSWGCASGPIPPSEPTIAALRTYHDEILKRVAAGELSPAQGRDLYYARLAEVSPPLPGLDNLRCGLRRSSATTAASEPSTGCPAMYSAMTAGCT